MWRRRCRRTALTAVHYQFGIFRLLPYPTGMVSPMMQLQTIRVSDTMAASSITRWFGHVHLCLQGSPGARNPGARGNHPSGSHAGSAPAARRLLGVRKVRQARTRSAAGSMRDRSESGTSTAGMILKNRQRDAPERAPRGLVAPPESSWGLPERHSRSPV